MEAVNNKYQGSKIYTIRSPHTDKYYIGSTVEKYLSRRFNGHKNNYKQYLNGTSGNITSFEIIKLGEAYIELLEVFPCKSNLELHKREGELIRKHTANCVNRKIEGRTQKEYKTENNDKIIVYQKEYRKDNKDKLNQISIEHYYKNKEMYNENQRKYRAINKIMINEKQRQYRQSKRSKSLMYNY